MAGKGVATPASGLGNKLIEDAYTETKLLSCLQPFLLIGDGRKRCETGNFGLITECGRRRCRSLELWADFLGRPRPVCGAAETDGTADRSNSCSISAPMPSGSESARSHPLGPSAGTVTIASETAPAANASAATPAASRR